MKIFNFFKKRKTKELENGVDITSVAERAFVQYKKTYKDLARYDRGEKIFNN